ncbi:hypothetical protein [Hephaestia mangrovi]|uniref:hypothetical protein n=1 Tax=Hephaestia mangrovi TaxID=2873268 RepID=UPI001CA76B55|nr:hypothetical protein [Hephaestia mangrovi]MBY8826964.1 hypothetical protein [Hephaestia mangrovi]
MKKLTFCVIALAVAAPASARKLSLLPFDTKLSFAPAAPGVIGPAHPFYHHIEVAPIVGMPEKLGAFLVSYTKRGEVQAALERTMADAGMLAPAGTTPTLRLTATWIAFDAPQKISFSSHATVTIRYELSRIPSGDVIFRRDITNQAKASGGDGAQRLQGTARSVILASLASATWCLEQSPLGGAPLDCTLHPVGRIGDPVKVWMPIRVPR